MKTQKCKYCQKKKPLDNFPVTKIVKGKEYRRLRCQNCYQQMKYARIKVKKIWVEKFKQNHACKHCGIDDFRVLVFHHRDPSKKETEIANAIRCSWGIERIKTEIAKCDILCANCHLILHWKERNEVSE